METLEFVASVADHYGLSRVIDMQFVPGGLLHRMMRLQTEEGVWAIKVLNRLATESAEGRFRLERAEEVAKQASEAGIPTATARLGPNGKYLQTVDEEIVILYHWHEGRILPPQAVSPEVATQMGKHLAQLHALQIRFPDQSAPDPEAFEEGHWEALTEQGQQFNTVWATAIEEALPHLREANTQAMQAQLALCEGWVTGHLDYDQKNVLWDEDGHPTILDWEAAKPIHPALEAMGAGLSWAGQSAGSTNEESFKAFFKGYTDIKPLSRQDLEVACDAVQGKWLIWLEFNLRRSLDPTLIDAVEGRIAQDALFHALEMILKLRDDREQYRTWVKNGSDS